MMLFILNSDSDYYVCESHSLTMSHTVKAVVQEIEWFQDSTDQYFYSTNPNPCKIKLYLFYTS